MTFYTILSAIGLLSGVLMGLGALFAPKWAQGVVRLVPDPDPEKPGGFSEFRATYGGLLFMIHIMALVILLYIGGYPTLFVLMTVASGWFGAGLGRMLSLLLDGKENRAPGMIPVWIPIELALALAIACPVLQIA